MIYGISKEQQLKVQRQKCLDLTARLEKGWNMCEERPDDKRLEAHWLKLLKEYESAVFQYVALGGATGEL